MSRYRKMIVAGVGLALLLVSNIVGVELGPEDESAALSVVDGVIALLTTFGVFQVRNVAPVGARSAAHPDALVR